MRELNARDSVMSRSTITVPTRRSSRSWMDDSERSTSMYEPSFRSSRRSPGWPAECDTSSSSCASTLASGATRSSASPSAWSRLQPHSASAAGFR